MDEQRRVFYALVADLLICPYPFRVAGGVLAELLEQVEELHQELCLFVDELVALGRVEKCPLFAAREKCEAPSN